MRTPLLLLLMLVACPKAPATLGDPSLPEAVAEVDAKAPMEELIAATGSTEPGLRARAYHLLLLATTDLGPWATAARYDDSAWVQRSAIDALVQRGPEGLDDLEALATSNQADPLVRGLAALHLPPGTVTVDWQQADSPWDRLPLALAAWHHGDDHARRGVVRALESGELPLDLPLVDALVRHGDRSLLDALAVAQERVEPELVTAIAAARLELGDPKGEVALRKALGGEVHERMEVLDRLATSDTDAAEDLLRRASSGGPDLSRLHAELLLTARTGQSSQRLHEALEDADREVRHLAVQAATLALRHGPASRTTAKAAVEVLVEALADPDPSVRAAAARGLGEHGGAAHQAVLSPLLGDEVPAVRVEAAGAILR